MLAYIFLHNCTPLNDILLGLALCIIPFILGWLAAMAFYKVMAMRKQVADLSAENGSLNAKIDGLNGDLTDLRVKLTQADAEIHDCKAQVAKLKNDIIILESDNSKYREQLGIGTGKEAAPKDPTPADILFFGTKYKWDDLKIVEGIGPKIAELFNNAGINTWRELANTSVDRLKEILDAAGPNFQIHDPGTWPKQAELAANEAWDELKKLQDELDAGKA